MKQREGYLTVNGYKTWYVVFGDLKSGRTPLLGLHGGPGFPHNHLRNLSLLAEKGIPVVLYDQLGCGKSDRPDDPSLWIIDTFLNELSEIRRALHLDEVFLLGHSWGGSLAAEYAVTQPNGLMKLILSSPLLDSQLWVAETEKLKDQMPQWAADVMREHEAAGTTDVAEYADAVIEFNNRFVCRIVPNPKDILDCIAGAGVQVYETMWGPSEAHATGNLKNWSVLDRLHGIDRPTLLLSGKYDEATPAQMRRAKEQIKNSRWVLLENSSHAGLYEETQNYLDTVEQFVTS